MVLRERDHDRGDRGEEAADDRDDPGLGALGSSIAGGGHGDLFHIGGYRSILRSSGGRTIRVGARGVSQRAKSVPHTYPLLERCR
ncbi:hypothetical protein GCM10009749_04460 [Agromyces neolithicus]|uniref:Uncharacterized protein n=1 Tax=Agromyces neolithicus TaxID=269420 RepID=A0ABP4Y3G1_9MICO